MESTPLSYHFQSKIFLLDSRFQVPETNIEEHWIKILNDVNVRLGDVKSDEEALSVFQTNFSSELSDKNSLPILTRGCLYGYLTDESNDAKYFYLLKSLALAEKDEVAWTHLCISMNQLVLDHFHILNVSARNKLFSLINRMINENIMIVTTTVTNIFHALCGKDYKREKDNLKALNELCTLLLHFKKSDFCNSSKNKDICFLYSASLMILSRILMEYAKAENSEIAMKSPIAEFIIFILTEKTCELPVMGRELFLVFRTLSKINDIDIIIRKLLQTHFLKDTKNYTLLDEIAFKPSAPALFTRIVPMLLGRKISFICSHIPPGINVIPLRHMNIFYENYISGPQATSLAGEVLRYVMYSRDLLTFGQNKASNIVTCDKRVSFICMLMNMFIKNNSDFSYLVQRLVWDICFYNENFESEFIVGDKSVTSEFFKLFSIPCKVILFYLSTAQTPQISIIFDVIFQICDSYKGNSVNCYNSFGNYLKVLKKHSFIKEPLDILEHGKITASVKERLKKHLPEFYPNKVNIPKPTNLMMNDNSVGPRFIPPSKFTQKGDLSNSLNKMAIKSSTSLTNYNNTSTDVTKESKKDLFNKLKNNMKSNMVENGKNMKDDNSVSEGRKPLLSYDKDNEKNKIPKSIKSEKNSIDVAICKLPNELQQLFINMTENIDINLEDSGNHMLSILTYLTENSNNVGESLPPLLCDAFSITFDNFFKQESFIPEKIDKNRQKEFFMHPFFVLPRMINTLESSDEARNLLLTLLSLLVKKVSQTGFLVLFFLNEEEGNENINSMKSTLYKDLWRILDVNSFEEQLGHDLKLCNTCDHVLFFKCLQYAFKKYQNEYLASVSLMKLMFYSLDPNQLTNLLEIIVDDDDIAIFTKSSFPNILLDSVSWPDYAQRNLWDLIDSQDIHFDWYVPCMHKLDIEKSPILRRKLYILFAYHPSPLLQMIKNIFLRSTNDKLPSMYLKITIGSEEAGEKLLTHLGQLLVKSLEKGEIYDNNENGKIRKISLELIYSHLNTFITQFYKSNSEDAVIQDFFNDKVIKKHFQCIKNQPSCYKLRQKYQKLLSTIDMFLNVKGSPKSNRRRRVRNNSCNDTEKIKPKRRRVDIDSDSESSDLD
ncbi:Integrator complex subunit 3 [Strongyloides ratti]|uniref:SOSS complex subunit A homolog n=1 Tax=Strongyloides ratti TaxID=34506 RepID=A0A090KZU7_STRRB|nr:Integrator complex subunit 3 [Strongyloides ratti]CEF63055.1 Integrator complex subunit 3 [Strongyloides ratti]